MTPRPKIQESSYQHDLLEPNWRLSRTESSQNINDAITPDPSGSSYAVDYQHDRVLDRIEAIDPELGRIYRHFKRPGSRLRRHNAGFFWLRLPKPNAGMSSTRLLNGSHLSKIHKEEVERIYEREYLQQTYRLPHQIKQAIRGCSQDDALMIR